MTRDLCILAASPGEERDPQVAETVTGFAPGDGFIPPYPYRSPTELTPRRRLRLAQGNLIAAFEDPAFELDFAALKFLTKHIFLCNSPETVQYAFGVKNENFERKSAAMRHMLRPLLGDGLFISEGEPGGNVGALSRRSCTPHGFPNLPRS
jgi:hypothetical protein